MKNFKTRVLSLFLAVTVCISMAVPVSAADKSYVSKSDFWQWAFGKGTWFHDIVGYTTGLVCPTSEDGYHHANSIHGRDELYYKCQCIYCGKEFTGYLQDVQDSYNDYVGQLPAQGISSKGTLLWSPAFNYLYVRFIYTVVREYYYGDYPNGNTDKKYFSFTKSISNDVANLSLRCISSDGSISLIEAYPGIFTSFPVSGVYSLYKDTVSVSGYRLDSAGASNPFSYDSYTFSYGTGSHSAGDLFQIHAPSFGSVGSSSPGFTAYLNASLESPVYEILPFDALDGTSYTTDTRPSSGGSFGYMDADGQLNASAHGSIFDEGSGLYINPQTGLSADIGDWYYDYSTRTYYLTTENGDTITVTYGDENITIYEGDTTYNIYYITYVDGDDDPSSGFGGTGSGNTGSGSGDSGSSGGGLGDALGKLIELVTDFLSGLLKGAVSLLTTVVGAFIDLLKVLLNFTTVFTDFLASLFPYMPSEVMTALSAGTIIVVVISIIKFIAGFF